MQQQLTFIEHLFNWKRITAFLWLSGAQIGAFLLADITTSISNHTIVVPAWAAIAVGLIISQITKAITNYIATQQALVNAQ